MKPTQLEQTDILQPSQPRWGWSWQPAAMKQSNKTPPTWCASRARQQSMFAVPYLFHLQLFPLTRPVHETPQTTACVDERAILGRPQSVRVGR